MTTPAHPHHRILHDADATLERRPFPAELASFPLLGTFSTHRRHRGPYTGAGSLLRYLVPGLVSERKSLLTAHDVELRAVAPELRDILPGTHETLTSTSGPEERTRFYPGAYTLRVAHGLTDLLLEIVAETGPRSLVFTDIDEADASDLQFLSVLWRRVSPGQLELVLVTRSGTVPPQLEAIGPQALGRIGSRPRPRGSPTGPSGRTGRDSARAPGRPDGPGRLLRGVRLHRPVCRRP